MSAIRKKSPRAPSVALDEAIDRARKVYEKEKCHPAPADAVAKHLGYTNARNGAAASAIASLRYYGLLERSETKTVAVSREIQEYLFAPSEEMRKKLLLKWLKTPPIFNELLDEYPAHLPSDETLKFNLIQKGFTPEAADSCLSVFRQSVDFSGYYDSFDSMAVEELQEASDAVLNVRGVSGDIPLETVAEAARSDLAGGGKPNSEPFVGGGVSRYEEAVQPDFDRIPVRLSGGRRAWIEVPSPLYAKDKERLKKQIDLLLTDDEEDC